MQLLTPPYNCRPLELLETMEREKWTQDEISAFTKFNGSSRRRFILEWEFICNELNPKKEM